jgi:hypothetical protein
MPFAKPTETDLEQREVRVWNLAVSATPGTSLKSRGKGPDSRLRAG